MPKPLLLKRPSGPYARFFVPTDLQAQVGSRYLVRPLNVHANDEVRLVAARLGLALSQAFEALRKGFAVDLDELLKRVREGTIRELTLKDVRLPNGIQVGEAQLESAKDVDLLMGMVARSQPSAGLRGDSASDFQARAEGLDEHMSAASQGIAASTLPLTMVASSGPLLSQEIEAHIGDLERRRLIPDTITESKHSLRLLLGIVGDMPVQALKAPHIRTFWEAVRWWPPRATVRPQYRGLSVAEIIAKGRAEHVPPPSPHTINKHKQRLGVFFNALVATDVIAKSPLRGLGQEIDTGTELETGRPFTPDELKQIFAPEHFIPWAKDLPHRWWGPMLGLYTGARVNEIAQLYLDDVQQVNGVWGLFIWKNDRNQKIKTKSSIRFVPLAQPLLDAGFLTFVEDMRKTGHPRLFPQLPAGTGKDGKPNGLGYGRQLSRQFSAYIKRFGIEKGTAFHAFRHTLSTSLFEAGVDLRTIAMITGHARKAEVPTLEKHYLHIADARTLPERVEALAKFRAPIGLQNYTSGQFAGLDDRSHP